MVLIKSSQKTTHFCLDSTTAALARWEAGTVKGKTGSPLHTSSRSPPVCRRASQAMTFWRCLLFQQTLYPAYIGSPSISSPHQWEGKFTDYKAECILQGWTFSPRMSHYPALIMLISQPLESCPAFHHQRWEERMSVVGAAPYLVKYSPSAPRCNSLYEIYCFMATTVLDPPH